MKATLKYCWGPIFPKNCMWHGSQIKKINILGPNLYIQVVFGWLALLQSQVPTSLKKLLLAVSVFPRVFRFDSFSSVRFILIKIHFNQRYVIELCDIIIEIKDVFLPNVFVDLYLSHNIQLLTEFVFIYTKLKRYQIIWETHFNILSNH